MGFASSNNSAACESSAYPDISAGDAAGLQDDASSALCNAMGDLGIDPEVGPWRNHVEAMMRHLILCMIWLNELDNFCCALQGVNWQGP